MAPKCSSSFSLIRQKIVRVLPTDHCLSFLGVICKILVISGLFIYFFSIFVLKDPKCAIFNQFSPSKPTSNDHHSPPTTVNHLVFGLVGSVKAWKHRKPYIESWWRPNSTRGYLFLDASPTPDLLPWPSSSCPPFRVSDNLKKLLEESRHVSPTAVRILHAILEVFREEQEGVRWYVMGDDDSIFFVDNMIRVLSEYDHTKFVYIGGQAETIKSDFQISFDMGFGGAGLILSYALAEVLVNDLENCVKRYSTMRFADKMAMSCIADIGVPFTSNRGIHQIDLRGDLSGFLSSHPQFPILSLHHFDFIDPIFPNKTRAQSSYHLMKAAAVDQSRLLQQTVCYRRRNNWTFSVSWGYSVHLYEKIIPRSILKVPIETFRPWLRAKQRSKYLLNTRRHFNDPCLAPHVFFFESIEMTPEGEGVLTTYARRFPRGLPACSSSGNHSADEVSRIRVLTSAVKRQEIGRSECCDIANPEGAVTNVAEIKFRACLKNEIIA